jgi:hypothetical protein
LLGRDDRNGLTRLGNAGDEMISCGGGRTVSSHLTTRKVLSRVLGALEKILKPLPVGLASVRCVGISSCRQLSCRFTEPVSMVAFGTYSRGRPEVDPAW